MRRSVLYIDPDEADQEQFREAIGPVEDLALTVVSGTDEAIDRLEQGEFDIVIAAATVGEKAINTLFDHVKKMNLHIPCIIFTEKGLDEVIEQNVLFKASAFVQKDRENAFEHLVDEIHEAMQPRSQIDYPVPADEDERLRSIEGLHLGRLQEKDAFDRLTKLARALFDVKFAFVGIVQEDVERFISFEGDDVEQLARECTICTFGILSDDATVIDDSQKDERFKYIDELRDLDIIFYAGHPIVDENGLRIGMFCIADDSTRDFDTTDRENLKLFAQEAGELIQLYEGEQ